MHTEERESLRRMIAEIVEKHLDEIVDETIAAYVRSIPSVATASAKELRLIRAATTRATQAFIQMYADPESPARQFIQQARAATLDRAGEVFQRHDIVEMISIGRHVVYQTARRFTEAEIGVTEVERADIQAALDVFLTELELADEPVMEVTPDVVMHFLTQAENEDPDIK